MDKKNKIKFEPAALVILWILSTTGIILFFMYLMDICEAVKSIF